MAGSSGRFESFFGGVTLFFFAITVIAITIPSVAIVLMFTGVGLPLGFLILFGPPVFAVLMPLFVLYTITPASRLAKVLIAFLLTALLLGLPPLWLNVPIKAAAEAWTRQDHNEIGLPLRFSSIGLKKPYNYEREASQCDDLCLRVLLTGTANRFLISFSDRPDLPPTGNEAALEFSLQRRDECPAVRFKPGFGAFEIPDDRKDGEKTNAIDLIQLRMATGECLIQRPASLRDADIVIARGQVKQGVTWLDAGFKLDADTITAFRTSVHSRSGAGAYEEVYRQTSIRYLEFGPLLMPVVNSGSDFKMAPGFMRFNRAINWSGELYAPPEMTGLLTETLGLDLALRGDQVGDRIADTIDRALQENRAPTAAEWSAFSTYVDRVLISDRHGVPESLYQLYLRILQDLRYPPPPRLHVIARQAVKRGNTADLEVLARMIVKRAQAGVTWSVGPSNNIATHWTSIGTALQQMPLDVLQPYKSELLEIARNPDAQAYGWTALSHLSVFGEDAAPTLLYLVNTGLSGGKDKFKSIEHEHPYLAGMTGLCKAGASARSALPQMRLWWEQGLLPNGGSHGKLVVSTLAGLGMSAEELWPRYSQGLSKPTRSDLDRLVKPGGKANWRCRY